MTAAPEAGPRTDAQPWLLRAAGMFALYVAFRCVLALVHLPSHTPLIALALVSLVVAFGSLGIPIAGMAALVKSQRLAVTAILAVVGIGIWLGLMLGLRNPPRALFPVLSAIRDAAMIVAVGGIGILLSRGIKEASILLPAGMFAAFADFVVVTRGTVHHAMQTQKGAAVIAAVSAKVPSLQRGVPPLTIGPADFLFLGLFLACAWRFQFGLRRNAIILTTVLAVSLALVPILQMIPALAPMSAAFIIANWRRFKLTKEELISTAVVLVLVGALFVGYFMLVFPRK